MRIDEDEEMTLSKQEHLPQTNLNTNTSPFQYLLSIALLLMLTYTTFLNANLYLTLINSLLPSPTLKTFDSSDSDPQLLNTRNESNQSNASIDIDFLNVVGFSKIDPAQYLSSMNDNEQMKKYLNVFPPNRPFSPNRLSLGSPSPVASRILILSAYQPACTSECLCLVTNAVNGVTNRTLDTGEAMFMAGTIYSKWILLLDSQDRAAKRMYDKLHGGKLGVTVKMENIYVDATYQWIEALVKGCHRVLYGQHFFAISQTQFQLIPAIISSKQPEVLFSRIVQFKSKSMQLIDLCSKNLQQVSEQQLNHYLFLFPPHMLKFITPLNFAFYAKYTVNQLLIVPILAAVQGSSHLQEFRQIAHAIDIVYGSGRHFRVQQNVIEKGKSGSHMCFVSYPTDPYTANFKEFHNYLQSLSQVSGINESTIVVNIPYRFNASASLHPFFQEVMDQSLPVRLRIRGNKTVSSLSCYEASHCYCPNPSLMIFSRYNIAFSTNFIQQLKSREKVQFHYYVGHFAVAGSTVSINVQNAGSKIRQNGMYFVQFLMHLQIVKMDLFKMLYFWILKCQEIDFYQSEASFVFPLLEMVKMSVSVIKMQLFSVTTRSMTAIEQEQLENLKLYLEWSPIPNNRLTPFTKNSLENEAFRKNAPNKIPKKLHQVWLGKGNISTFQQRLHQTLIDKNPDFIMKLWRDEDITIENFPLTYALIKRSIEYQRFSDRSYSAPTVSLIRYELLYRHGGIYMDFKTEGLKHLSPFLKYSLFFIDVDYEKDHYSQPKNVGNGIIGAEINCYQLHLTLTELISEERFDFKVFDFPKIVGGFVLRKALTESELFQSTGYGFQLFSQKPGTGKPNLCSTNNWHPEKGKEMFRVSDYTTGKLFTIGIPCSIYKQSYLMMYKVLAGTWRVKKKSSHA